MAIEVPDRWGGHPIGFPPKSNCTDGKPTRDCARVKFRDGVVVNQCVCLSAHRTRLRRLPVSFSRKRTLNVRRELGATKANLRIFPSTQMNLSDPLRGVLSQERIYILGRKSST